MGPYVARRRDQARFVISDQPNASHTAQPSATQPADAAQPKTPGQTVRIGVTDFAPDRPLLEMVLASLDYDSAEDVVAIDLTGKSAIADHMVVASATSARLVGSICQKLIERLKAFTGASPRAEGLDVGDWALIDAGDVIIHVFRPEVRDYYALEKMWAPEKAAERATAAARRQSA